jgi:hypothetical protein
MTWRITVAIGLAVCLAASVWAQGGRTSTLEPNSSMTFQKYFEPFPRVDTPEACRDTCVRDTRCTGWTYYHATFQSKTPDGNQLKRACILGSGLKDRRSNAPGRTSGEVK